MTAKQTSKGRDRLTMTRELFLRIDTEMPGVAGRRSQEQDGSITTAVTACNRKAPDAGAEDEPCGKPIAFVLDPGALAYALVNDVPVPDDWKGYTSPCDVVWDLIKAGDQTLSVSVLAFTWMSKWQRKLPAHNCRFSGR